MKVRIKSEVVQIPLRKIEKVINWRNLTPILQGVYLECTPDELIFIGSDGTETLRLHVPVDEGIEVLTPGKVIIPKQGVEVLKKIKSKLEMEVLGNILHIKYGRSKVQVVTLDAEDYPKLPLIDFEEPPFVLTGAEFRSLIKKTAFAAAKNEIRPILQGVHVKISPEEIRMVCTDSHRLGQARRKKEGRKADAEFVVPAKALDKAGKIFEFDEQDVEIFSAQNHIVMKNGYFYIYCRLLEGNYPDTAKLIPIDFKSEIKIHREELFLAIDRISGLTKGENSSGVVKLTIKNEMVELSTIKTESKGVEIIDIEEITGEKEFSIAFSADYMMEALHSFDDEEFIFLKYQGNMRPFVISPGNLDELQLILPVRI